LEESSALSSRCVLLVTNDSRNANLIRESLPDAGAEPFRVEWVCQPSDAIERLKQQKPAAIILDLSVPGSHGIEPFDQVSKAAPTVPILILSGATNEEDAKQALRRGAQDYLPKRHLNSYSLPRAVQTVIALKLASEALFSDRERAEVTLNSIGDAVLSTDLQGKITYLNTVAERMTGWKREEAYGRPLGDVFQVINKSTHEPAHNPLEAAVQQGQTVSLTKDSLLVRRDGLELAIEDSAAPVRDREGRVVGAVIVFRDVGESQALARQMAKLAQHDALTQLPNRLLLNDRLTQALAMAERHKSKLAVMFLDLDNFKLINDSLGHVVGDAVLLSVAQRLCKTLRHTDTVSRQGGDEFLILLPEIDGAERAALVAEKILTVLMAPHTVDGREVRVTPSIGISIYPDHAQDAESLVHSADVAMYQAKKSGGGKFRLALKSES
jgi:diguanylate cyclase (GGDEF)-like protein/PAS domain S-box-containing protein